MPQENKTAKSAPLFSIIVPAYNVEDYITVCLESVLAQTCSDLELVIVDDGSTDKTGQICNNFAKNWPHNSIVPQINKKVNRKTENSAKITQNSANFSQITLIYQPNQGLSAARNTGVAAARGEYLIFLDGDDFLEPTALENIKNALKPNLDLLRFQAQTVSAEIISINNQTTTVIAKTASNSSKSATVIPYPESSFATTTGPQAFAKIARFHFVENAWVYAYRRTFFQQNHFQFAVGRLNEDFGLVPLVIAKAAKVKSISAICYNYRQRQGSIMHDAAQIQRRLADIAAQLQIIIPQIALIPHTTPILHYLVVSFLTGATGLSRPEFLQIYQTAKQNGWLKYIHPTRLKSLPRSLLLKFAPGLAFRVLASG